MDAHDNEVKRERRSSEFHKPAISALEENTFSFLPLERRPMYNTIPHHGMRFVSSGQQAAVVSIL
jgi:hypothetical protein